MRTTNAEMSAGRGAADKGETGTGRAATVVPPDAGDTAWVGSELVAFKLTGRATADACMLTVNATLPHGGPPLHRHSREDEFFYVLEGEFLVQSDGQTTRAAPGTAVSLPRGTTHTYTNAGTAPGKLLVLCVPAGIERFWAEVGQPGSDVASPPPPPTPAQLEHLATAALHYGIEVVGPPLG